MTNEIQEIIKSLDDLKYLVSKPFWLNFDFWIVFAVGIAGVLFALLAFLEARKAKHAATEAGRMVKIQTITIELTEISQRLDTLQPEIKFNEARDFLNEISRKLRRLISPFKNDADFSETINILQNSLSEAKNSLQDVRPSGTSEEDQTLFIIYNAIESDFSTINGHIADLIGLFESKI